MSKQHVPIQTPAVLRPRRLQLTLLVMPPGQEKVQGLEIHLKSACAPKKLCFVGCLPLEILVFLGVFATKTCDLFLMFATNTCDLFLRVATKNCDLFGCLPLNLDL